jgi:transposase-like protein
VLRRKLLAQLGQKYAVNANQIFLWRRQYHEEQRENNTSIDLLPVTVSNDLVVKAANPRNMSGQAPAGTLKIANYPKEIYGLRGA